jgi:hypothetical protein
VTVTTEVPLFPALVAVIVAEPAAMPETTPVELTAAKPVLLVDQDTLWPLITFPFPSFTVAARVVVVPTIREVVDGSMTTVATLDPFGGVGSVVVPPGPEQTATIGSSAIGKNLRRRLVRADICCMAAPAFELSGASDCRATKRRRGTDYVVGFAGGSAGVAGFPRQPRGSATPPFDGFALSSVLAIRSRHTLCHRA